jgi:hypothetical protein
MTPAAPIQRSVDLTEILSRWAKLIIASMRRNVTQQKGADFRRFQPLAASTLKARKYHKPPIEGTKRLRATGALLRDGFVTEVSALKLEIGLSDAPHPDAKKGQTFDQIGAWNDAAATPEKPWNPRWWGVPQVMADDATAQITAEVEKQLLTGGLLGTTVQHVMRA